MKPLHSEGWSAVEREGLGLWQAHQPTAGFADRVLAEALDLPTEAPVRGARGMAAAAVVALVLGGLWSLRSLVGQPGRPAGYQEENNVVASPDGGPRPEVNFDGTEAQSS